MPTVLFEPSLDVLFDNGTQRCWNGVQETAVALAMYYVENGRQGLDIRYSAEFPHAPLVVPPGLCDELLCEWFGHWSSAVTAGLVEEGLL